MDADSHKYIHLYVSGTRGSGKSDTQFTNRRLIIPVQNGGCCTISLIQLLILIYSTIYEKFGFKNATNVLIIA